MINSSAEEPPMSQNNRGVDAKTEPLGRRQNETENKYQRNLDTTKHDSESRFESLRGRFSEDSLWKMLETGHEKHKESMYPSSGLVDGLKSLIVDTSCNSSSGTGSTMSLYNAADTRQDVFNNTFSKNVKIPARVGYAPEQDLEKVTQGMPCPERDLFQDVNPQIHKNEFEFYLADQNPRRDLVAGRPRLTDVDYKVGDSIKFSSREPGECKHCHCCQRQNQRGNDGKVDAVIPKSKATWRMNNKSESSKNKLDTFIQLKQVNEQWRKVSKRHVPKSNREFWEAIKNDITPRPSDRQTSHRGWMEISKSAKSEATNQKATP